MLCCFGRPAYGQDPISPPHPSLAQSHAVTVVKNITTTCLEPGQSNAFVNQTTQLEACPDIAEDTLKDPWRARLSERLASWASSNGVRAAGCWVCTRDRGKCVLVGAAPNSTGNLLRSALHGFFLGSTIDLTLDGSTSVACAISTKTLVSVVVLASGQVIGEMPVDLRQLYERLCRTFISMPSGQKKSNMAGAWHLAALPLLVHHEAVGALVLAGQLEVPPASPESMESCVKAAVQATMPARLSAAASLTAEFFGTPVSLACAQEVVSLIIGVLTAPDHAAAVRNAAVQIHTLLPKDITVKIAPETSCSPSLALLTPTKQELLVTTGLVVSRGVATRTCTASNVIVCNTGNSQASAATQHMNAVSSGHGASAGPQLHLYHGINCRAATILPISETLITRAPIRADVLAAMLSEALAAPVSSAALAGVGARNPGAASMRGGSAAGPHQQKLLTLRCPEDQLPASQPRGDLLALEAAGARAPRGSVVLVSCPLPSIMCAVVVYVCIGPLCAEARHAASQALNQTYGIASGGPGESLRRPADLATENVEIAEGKGAMAKGLQVPALPDHVVQLTEVQLMRILKHASSAVEIMASALEHRILSSCAASPARLAIKGPCAIDVTADTSGLVTVSMAGTDGEDSNGFWGSASGPILSGESISTSHLSGAATIPSASNSVSTASPSVGCSSKPLPVPNEYAKSATPGAAALGATDVASSPGSPCAVSSFPTAQIPAKEVCMTKVSLSETVYQSCFQTATETIESIPEREITSEDGSAATAASRCAEQQRQAGSGAVTATCSVFEQPFVPGPGATVAGSSLAKLPSIRNRPPAKVPTNDTDVSQDNAQEGGPAVTSPAVVTSSVDIGVRGARSSAVALPCSASGCSGVESTIKARTCSRMVGDSKPGQIEFQHLAADESSLNPGKEISKVVQMMAGSHKASCRSHTPQAGAQRLFLSCDDNVSSASGGDAGQPLASNSSSITRESLAVAGVSSAPVVTAAPEGGPYGRPLTEGKSLPSMSVEDGGLIVQRFGSNSHAGGGGCSVTSASGDQLARVIVRNRSKDWSDQAGDPESGESRFAATGNAGSVGMPRLRSIKVLSLDKAAQQLQRTSGSSITVGMQSMLHPPLHLQQQQSFHKPGTVKHDGKDGLPVGGVTTALGASATPLSAYVPRRLNRMYLQAGVQGASGAIGLPSTPGNAIAKATLIARPYESPLLPSSEPLNAAPSPPPAHFLQPIQLAARSHGADYYVVPPGGPTAPMQSTVGQPGHLVPARDGFVRLLAGMHAASGGLVPSASRLSDSNLSNLQVAPSGPLPPALMHIRTILPPAVVTKVATTSVNARAGGVGAGTGSPSASASNQTSHQLSDFAIPEDAPLEYTVSETVQMMRMLAQARGVHLSARMRRVRITAKIQSAHPEDLPANLPSQIAKSALAQSADGGGLFAGVGRGPAAANGGSWVLTGIAARRGCVELVFDVVQVRGSSSWDAGNGNGAHELPEDVCTLALRNVVATAGSNNGQQVSPIQLRGTSQGSVASHGLSLEGCTGLAVPQPQKSGQTGSNGQSYRRWQGAGAETVADTQGLWVDHEDAVALQVEHAAGAALKAPAGTAAAGEQLWLRNMCGVRPEAVADVLHSCGLLSPSSDPFIDIQIGHTVTGNGTLVWHEASGKWVAANAGTQVIPTTTATASPSTLEIPTLWLPTAVAILARGARILQDIRVVSTAACNDSRMDVVDELTVRSAFGFLPIRTAVGLRMHAGGAAGSGSSVPPLPLLLEDDPVAESLVDSTCVWRLVDIGGALPRNGGLLLVECRRSARGLQGTFLEPPSMPATPTPAFETVASSAPVPLVVLPEQQAAAAAELQRLRVYMARMLLGSEDVLRTNIGPPPTGDGVTAASLSVQTRADAAAQVEMACQQFLMDIGVLLDAAASGAAPVNSSRAQVQRVMPASGPSSCPQPGFTTGGGPVSLVNVGSTSCGGGSATGRATTSSFSEAQSTSHSRRPELQVSPVCTTDALSSMPSCSSPLTMLGACGVGRGTEVMGGWASEAGGGGFGGSCTASDATWNFAEDMRVLMQPRRASSPGLDGSRASASSSQPPVVGITDYGEHLMDVACTALAGCCTAGMLHTAMLVLELACRDLSLAMPELLLAEAGAEPAVSIELLSVYATRTRQACKDYGCPPSTTIKTGTPGTCILPATSGVTAAAAVPGNDPTQGVCVRVRIASSDGVGFPENVSRGDVDWSTTTDGQTAAHSLHSRSHSLAVMLSGPRSSPTSPLTLQERDGEAMPSVDFGSWQQDENRVESAAQNGESESEGTEVTATVPVVEAGTCVLDPLPHSRNSPCTGCEAVDLNFQGSVASDFMPTWGSLSAAGTPDSGARMAYRDRAASNLLCSADMTTLTAGAAVGVFAMSSKGRISGVEADAQANVSPMQSNPVLTEQPARAAAAVSDFTESTSNTRFYGSAFQVAALPLASAWHSSSYDSASAVVVSCCGGSRLSLARFSGAGCTVDPVPTEEVGSEEERSNGFHRQQRQSKCVASAVPRHGSSSDNATTTTTVLQRDRSDRLAGWAMCFSDPAVEAEYMQFVATRTCSIMWSYFICNAVISGISCTRAWMEDGIDGCLTMLIFSGLQGVIMGWFCLAHCACNSRAMVAAAVSCKAVRTFSDALMGWRVLKVPSLMEPMTMRGIELWSEALMRPMAERVPFASYRLMVLFELPCVYLAYRQFKAIFPECWMRRYPLLRTFAFILLAGVVNVLVELYWRRKFRRWYVSGAGGDSVAAGAHMAMDAVIEESTSPANKPYGKDD